MISLDEMQVLKNRERKFGESVSNVIITIEGDAESRIRTKKTYYLYVIVCSSKSDKTFTNK